MDNSECEINKRRPLLPFPKCIEMNGNSYLTIMQRVRLRMNRNGKTSSQISTMICNEKVRTITIQYCVEIIYIINAWRPQYSRKMPNNGARTITKSKMAFSITDVASCKTLKHSKSLKWRSIKTWTTMCNRRKSKVKIIDWGRSRPFVIEYFKRMKIGNINKMRIEQSWINKCKQKMKLIWCTVHWRNKSSMLIYQHPWYLVSIIPKPLEVHLWNEVPGWTRCFPETKYLQVEEALAKLALKWMKEHSCQRWIEEVILIVHNRFRQVDSEH